MKMAPSLWLYLTRWAEMEELENELESPSTRLKGLSPEQMENCRVILAKAYAQAASFMHVAYDRMRKHLLDTKIYEVRKDFGRGTFHPNSWYSEFDVHEADRGRRKPLLKMGLYLYERPTYLQWSLYWADRPDRQRHRMADVTREILKKRYRLSAGQPENLSWPGLIVGGEHALRKSSSALEAADQAWGAMRPYLVRPYSDLKKIARTN